MKKYEKPLLMGNERIVAAVPAVLGYAAGVVATAALSKAVNKLMDGKSILSYGALKPVEE